MAKRAQKPPKKREQPWMASAREKLRGKSPVPNERQIQEAFLEIVNAAVDADPGAEPAVVIARAKWAWNLPLVHALSIRPGSEGDQVRDEAGRWLSGPAEEIAAVVPLAQDRIARQSPDPRHRRRHRSPPDARAHAGAGEGRRAAARDR